MYIFTLTPIPPSPDYTQADRQGETKLSFTITPPAAVDVSVMAFGIQPRCIFISKSGGVFKNY